MKKKIIIIIIAILLLCFISIRLIFSSSNDKNNLPDHNTTKTENINPSNDDEIKDIDSKPKSTPSKDKQSTNSDDSGLDENIEGTIIDVTNQ